MSCTTSQPGTVRYLPTSDAYDRWASVYDTDGNFLQAMDDIEMRSLLSRFEAATQNASDPRKLVDLGCGTGRNTALLLGIQDAQVVALDASEGMLAVAERKLRETRGSADNAQKLTFGVFDLIAAEEPPQSATRADGIISTLVLEHIPLKIFFRHVSQMLKPGGVLLLTNMHAEMGKISQAGFVDEATGEKIRPTSFAHTVDDVIKEAAKWNLTILSDADKYSASGGVKECAVTEEMIDQLGPRSRKWVGVTCWFGGLFKKTLP